MLAKIVIKNNPGKLFTSKVTNGEIGKVSLVRTVCDCGANTQRVRVCNRTTISGNIPNLPEIVMFTGGVGSFCHPKGVLDTPLPHSNDELRNSQVSNMFTWNWSGRIGAWVVVNPICVVEGYAEVKDLPPAPQGMQWQQSYCGNTLRTFVMLGDNTPHFLTIAEEKGICPPCMEKSFLASEFANASFDRHYVATEKVGTEVKWTITSISMGKRTIEKLTEEEDGSFRIWFEPYTEEENDERMETVVRGGNLHVKCSEGKEFVRKFVASVPSRFVRFLAPIMKG